MTSTEKAEIPTFSPEALDDISSDIEWRKSVVTSMGAFMDCVVRMNESLGRSPKDLLEAIAAGFGLRLIVRDGPGVIEKAMADYYRETDDVGR